MKLYITRYLECFTCIYIAQLHLLRGPDGGATAGNPVNVLKTFESNVTLSN